MTHYTIEFYDHADQKGLTFGIDDKLNNVKLNKVKEQVHNFLTQATDYAYAMIVSPKGYNIWIVKR